MLQYSVKLHTILLFIVCHYVNCANILCIFPTPFYSHQSFFRPIWHELIKSEHNVTILTTHPLNSTLNSRIIDLSFTNKLIFETHNTEEIIQTEKNVFVLLKHLFTLLNNMTDEQLKYPEVMKIIQNDNEKFDLMIIETHALAWFGLTKKFNCPIIGITSMPLEPFFINLMGNNHNPLTHPHINLPFVDNLTFLQRVAAVLFDWFFQFQIRYITLPAQERLIKKYVMDENIDLIDILKNNVSLIFENVIPGFNKPATTIPTIVKLHGLQLIRNESQLILPDHLKSFMDDAENGVIYFNLGTNVKSNLLSENQKLIFLEVFQHLPYRIIWKYENQMKDSIDNITITPWAPQQAILNHNKTKLFITQGGIQSIEEAIFYKVPILGIPFFGDQFQNIKKVELFHIGKSININELNKQLLEKSINELIKNQTYKNNIEEFSKISNEEPFKSLETAIWWIEYVLRHDTKHLKSPNINLPNYQYYFVDILSLVIIAIFTIIIFIITVLRCNKKSSTKGRMKYE